MTKKKPKPRPRKLGLNNHERALYKHLVEPAKRLVLQNPPNRDGYGFKHKLQIVWTKAFPRPKGFPVGRLISDIDGRRITEHLACTVLDWLFDNRLTIDSPKKLYKARNNALISLAHIERNLFNVDEKIFQDMLDTAQEDPQNSCVETTNEEELE